MAKRLGNITAAVALGLLLAGTAVDAKDTKTMTTTANLNVRSGAGTQYSIVGSYKKNTSVQVIEIDNGWAKVTYNGKAAYCSASYLKDTKTKTMKTTARLNVRKGPGTNYAVLDTLDKGKTVSVISISNGWAKISFKGSTGYCSTQYLEKVSNNSNSNQQNSNQGNSNSTKTMVATANLNVRSGAGTKYSIIGSYSKGAKVSVVSIKDGWAKVNYNGKAGYCSAEYLKKSATTNEVEPEESYTLMEATTCVNVRKGPGTSYDKVGMLNTKDQVKVISIKEGWAKITYNNEKAYVSASYLKEVAPKKEEATTYQIMKSTTYLNVRKGTSMATEKVGLLSPDEEVKVISISDGWAKILYNNEIAYCSSSYLAEVEDSTTKPNTPSTPEAPETPNSPSITVDSNNNRFLYNNNNLSFTLNSFIKAQMSKSNTSTKGETINESTMNKYINTDLILNGGNVYQFLKVNRFRNMNAKELNNYLNSLSCDTFHGQGQSFIDAAREYDMDPLYLVAHTILETGYGKSTLARGVDYEVPQSDSGNQGGEKQVVRVYNLFGIGAHDEDPIGGGAATAYKNGWTSIELAIKGGAKWIANNYVHSSRAGQHQYTVYMMRWNTNNFTNASSNVIWHQYASDITWAESVSSLMNKLSYLYNDTSLELEIPVFMK